jgi:hypothetical protein
METPVTLTVETEFPSPLVGVSQLENTIAQRAKTAIKILMTFISISSKNTKNFSASAAIPNAGMGK